MATLHDLVPASDAEVNSARAALVAALQVWLLTEARAYDDAPAPRGTDTAGFVRYIGSVLDTELQAAIRELNTALRAIGRAS